MLPVTRAYVEEGQQWFQQRTQGVIGAGHILIASRMRQEKVSWDLNSDINFAIHSAFLLLSIKAIRCGDKHSLAAASKRDRSACQSGTRASFLARFSFR